MEEEEEAKWRKPFRNALDKSDRKKSLIKRCLNSHPTYIYMGEEDSKKARKKRELVVFVCVLACLYVYTCI